MKGISRKILEENKDEKDEFELADDSGVSKEDFEALAKECIVGFFSDKTNSNGEEITKDILCNPEHINLILNTDICKSIDVAYKTIKASGVKIEELREEEEEKISDDVKLVLFVLGQCASKGVPKYFAGGMLLLYLKLCKNMVLTKN